MFHTLKLRFRRRLRKRQKQAGQLAAQSGDDFDRYIIERLGKLPKVGRFVAGWLFLFVLLIACVVAQNQALSRYYQTRQPVAGGIYSGGTVGSFTNANPIYATNPVDKTVSKLIFAGLFKYDSNNRLVGDLAKDWSVDTTGKIYTVHLRNNLVWHDGKPLTAKDVAFTYSVIQNPDAESPLLGSWSGIKVAALNRGTVTFTLPNPLSSFIYTATNGIVPQHLLGNVPMVGMRSASFNTKAPIGAGPFMWRDSNVKIAAAEHAQTTIGLAPFEHYWSGAPKLKSFVVHAYFNKDDMIDAFNRYDITAMSGLETVPDSVATQEDVKTYSLPLTAATMVFFKTTNGVLKDVKVRQALVRASNPAAIISKLGYQTTPVNEPLLIGQLGYDPQYAQKTNDLAAANQLLNDAGWIAGPNGLRYKDGLPLKFALSIAETSEYRRVASQLQSQWRQLGVSVQVDRHDAADFRNVLGSHSYDAVLYGVSIGVDPDVFVYWDSSQADIRSSNRLNLSEYNSAAVDDALDGGRTRTGDALRVIKYRTFLQQWQQDTPALGLYQPRSLFISHGPVYGLTEHSINDASERLYGANQWMIRTARVTNEFTD